MDLLCTEMTDHNLAPMDAVIYKDERVLDNMLQLDDTLVPKFNYFHGFQKCLEPYMREIVIEWMHEVCEEQMCEDHVFPLAVNYFDRFLCCCELKPNFIQCLGATTLLIASKVHQCNAFSVELLSAYTDRSVSAEDIRNWEMLVLSKLQWNMITLTGIDYIDHILERISWSEQINPLIRRHAQFLVSICCIDIRFMQSKPSLVAASCICSAAQGLTPKLSSDFVLEISRLTRNDLSLIEESVAIIEQIIATKTKQMHIPTPNTVSKPVEINSQFDQQPETPTDIEDING